jgi:hypothetical protein
MDRQYIDDRHVVARYLADQLADDERQAFEAYYLEHPEILQELEATARFKIGLMQLRDAGKIGALLEPQPWYRRTRYLAAVAAAAAVVIGVLTFNARNPAPRPLLIASADALVEQFGSSIRIAGTYTIMRVRGSAYDADIELPASPQIIALRVLPEVVAEPPRYRVTLASIADDESVHEIASVAHLQPDSDDHVLLFLNSEGLQRGRYQLSLSGDAGTSTAATTSTFSLHIR